MIRVLIADAVDASCAAKLRAAGIEVIENATLDEAGLTAAVADVDGLIVRGRAKVTRGVLDGSSRLRVVVRAGSGLDTIDVAAAQERGVDVRNVPGGNSVSVAELVFALFLSLARHVPDAVTHSRAGTAARGKPMGTELAGKTLGIVGCGRIGREVARRAGAFEMRVIAADPALASGDAASLGIELMPLADVLRAAHVITVHVPLLPATRGLLGPSAFALMQPGVLLVNAARAEVLDHDALLGALVDGRVAGAGLDVIDANAPAAPQLLAHPRVYVTPHLGASTSEAQRRVAEAAADLAIEVLTLAGPRV